MMLKVGRNILYVTYLSFYMCVFKGPLCVLCITICLFSRYMSRIPVTSLNLVSSHGCLKLSYTEQRKWFQRPQNKCTFDILKGGEKMRQMLL